MPNFKKLAKPYHENAIAALQEFVRKESVYDPNTISEGAPYGKGVKSALDYIGKLAKEYGFKVDYCGGYATEISFGEDQGPLIGIYAHSDVVPVSGKWSNPPFKGEIVGEGKERKMIGRGTSDDKGPLIASLYALKCLKDNGLIKGYRVRLVSGGDEERGSSCLVHYFNELKKEQADYAFTPDADFPLIYAEKGINHSNMTAKVDLKPIIAMEGGTVANAVCDKLVITLPLDKKFIEQFKKDGIDGDISISDPIMIVTFKGKSAHASTPNLGKSAVLAAFAYLGNYYHIDFLSNLAKVFADPYGASFDGQCESPELGKSTFNYGIVKYDTKCNLLVTLDYRYGENANPKDALAKLEKASNMKANELSNLPILLFDKKSPLVSTLMKSYKRMTHKFFDKPMAIGGGTYAKEAKNCVAYGSAFKNHPGDIHSPNEYIYIDDLTAQIAIYADAIYSLGKLGK